MGIIRSILDTDLYKFTTSYAYSKLFPRAFGEFEFVDRSNGDYPEGFDRLVRRELDGMTGLALTGEEENFVRKQMPYLPPIYIDFLKGFRFDPSEVDVRMEGRKLHIRATGLLYRVTLWRRRSWRPSRSCSFGRQASIPTRHTWRRQPSTRR